MVFDPGTSPEVPANLSSKKTISFWAKGNGNNYAMGVETEENQGSMPTIKPFAGGREWKPYSFPLSSFNTHGHDITGIAFARAQQPGKFVFEIDAVEIK